MTSRQIFVIGLHVAVTAALATVSALAGYVILFEALKSERVGVLQSYIRVRAEREQILFDEALAFNEAATLAFQRRVAALDDDALVASQFDALYPHFGDGTRRSAPGLYDGMTLPGGDHVYGVGAFLADAGMMTLEDKRHFLAAFHTVRTVGEAHLARFTSLYYFTPDSRAVLFAPLREDRLEYYRLEAPSDFRLVADEDPRLFGAATNPQRAMQCTRLSRYVYADNGERAATACRLPIYEGDRLIGAFGTSIQMNDHITHALSAPPRDGVNLLFDREGQVIGRGEPAGRELVPVDPREVMALLADDPRPNGVVMGLDSGHVLAFSRVAGPDWYFVSVVSLEALRGTAGRWAWALFFTVFFASLVFASVRGVLSNWLPIAANGFNGRARPSET
ncbi:hypothetical protein [Maricaulis sp. CAU 1757]